VEVAVVSQLVRIRSLAPVVFALLLLAALPASARAASGGAAPAPAGGGGGAAAGAVAPAPSADAGRAADRRVRSAGGASPRRKPPRRRVRVRRVPVVAAPPPAPAALLADGTASPPAGAPAEVAAVIAAGNRIASLPYRWGGGHRTWEDVGYDCSGSVGYALHGGGLLDATSDSTGLMSYGDPGPGTWITIYANRGHVYMVVAGLRFDTSGADPSRWQADARSGAGFAVRHPAGL
jgi:cell wall-associated NlpC family hydrolase